MCLRVLLNGFDAIEMCSGHCGAPIWDEKNKVLLLDKVYARGLTRTLLSDFTPEFSGMISLKEKSNEKSQEKSNEKPFKFPKKRYGRKIGSMVDANLATWTATGVTPKNTDPRFNYICKILNEKRWIPLRAQFPVGCHELRLATKIDLIVTDVFHNIIILEIKCGFEGYFDTENQGTMKYPFQKVPTSCRNNAYLQLMISEYLFLHCKHELNGKSESIKSKYMGAYLLHVFQGENNSFNHTLTMLPDWCKDTNTLEQCIEILKQSRFYNQKDRKRALSNGARRAKSKRIS